MHGFRRGVGKTVGMDNREGAHPLASWIRQPESSAAAVAVLGIGLLVASLFLPVGLANLALSALGAACAVIGGVTVLLHLLGRLLGLHRRADRVVHEGRSVVVFPGVRPPVMYLRAKDHPPVSTAPDSSPLDAAAPDLDLADAAPASGRYASASAGPRQAQPTAAAPDRAASPSPRDEATQIDLTGPATAPTIPTPAIGGPAGSGRARRTPVG